MNNQLAGLTWLPEHADWTMRVQALGGAPAEHAAWAEAIALANTRLDLARTLKLDRVVRELFASHLPHEFALRTIRLAVLGSSFTGHLLPAIRVAAIRRNIWVETYETPFDQYWFELQDARSGLHKFQPTSALLTLDAYKLSKPLALMMARDLVEEHLGRALSHVRQCCSMARRAFGCDLLVQTPLPIIPSLLGENEHRLPGSQRNFIMRYNEQLRELAEQETFDVVATDAAAWRDGLSSWHDPQIWHRSKQEISPLIAPLYGDLVARVIAAKLGLARKCLVLDLDNTLWGGEVGEVGAEGLVIGPGSAQGEAFAAVQAYVRKLAERGVILAVCSKNDERKALDAFQRHPEMLLSCHDIAAWAVNWENKPANIGRIADQLNIGLDAIVFLDDNPFERDFVRSVMPMVAVPEISDDPASVPEMLAAAGYFEAVTVTQEDFGKRDQYQARRKWAQLSEMAMDRQSYLSALDMRLTYCELDEINLVRAVQLINKTNQFNLTCIRRSEADVRTFVQDPSCHGWCFRLSDKLGDNGIISVVLGELSQVDTFRIDTWLMSCRVLGREVELAVLEAIIAELRPIGISRLVGRYIPSSKNHIVKDHYSKLGFQAVGQSGVADEWILNLDQRQVQKAPMAVQKGESQCKAKPFILA